jgi:hypothetical protein
MLFRREYADEDRQLTLNFKKVADLLCGPPPYHLVWGAEEKAKRKGAFLGALSQMLVMRIALDNVDNFPRARIHEHDVIAPDKILDWATAAHHDDVWGRVVQHNRARQG